MTYILTVLKDSPAALWALDGNTDDVTTRGFNATEVGSVEEHQSLVAGTGSSSLITDTNYLSYPAPVFRTKPFSLEAWVKPIDIQDTSYVLGQENFGIYVTPTHIVASIELENSSVYTVSHKIFSDLSRHVVMTFNGRLLELYVDGEVSSVDISAEDYGVNVKNGTVVDTLYSRGSVGSSLAIDCPAIYGYVLSRELVQLHYRRGLNVMSAQAIVIQYGGAYYDISDNNIDIYRTDVFDNKDAWLAGRFTNVGASDRLDALLENELTLEGTWEYAINMSDPEEGTIDGIKIDWRGENETVEYNLNDAGWVTATQRSLIPIPLQSSLTEMILELRVTLASGQEESYISDLKVTTYKNFELHSIFRDATVSQALIADFDTEPIVEDSNKGTNGTITIPAEEDWQSVNLVSNTTVNVGSASSDHEESEFMPIEEGPLQFKMDASATAIATASANLKFYDTDQLEILPENFMFYDDTNTSLAEELTEGSTHIVLADATNYPDATTRADEGRGMIFWNYGDYEVRQYSRYVYNNLWSAGAIVGNTIELDTPWTGPTIPAGTEVNSYRSATPETIIDMNLTTTPQPYEVEINFTDRDGADITGIYPGTAYARLFFETPDSVDYTFENIHLKPVGVDPTQISAIEMWIKIDDSVTGTIATMNTATMTVGTTISVSTGSRYMDGFSGSVDIIPNRWHHVIWIFSYQNEEIVIGAPGVQIGHLALYEEAPHESIYQLYQGYETDRVNDSSSVDISVADEEVNFYSYDWSLTSIQQ